MFSCKTLYYPLKISENTYTSFQTVESTGSIKMNVKSTIENQMLNYDYKSMKISYDF